MHALHKRGKPTAHGKKPSSTTENNRIGWFKFYIAEITQKRIDKSTTGTVGHALQ